MNENQQFSDKSEESIDLLTEQASNSGVDRSPNNELAKVAIGTLIGAALGGLTAALTMKGTTEKVDQAVKGVGNAVKGATKSFNQTVTNVSGAIKSVANSVNETVKDVGDAVKDTASEVNNTATNTVDAVKGTAVEISDTVKDTVDAVKGAAEGVKDTVEGTVDVAKSAVEDDTLSGSQSASTPNIQTTYMLVPIDKNK